MSAVEKIVMAMTLVSVFALSSLGSAGQVMIENASGPAGLVDVYVDDQLVARNLFPANTTFFPVEIAPGEHTVMVKGLNGKVVASGEMTFDGFQQWLRLKDDNTLTLKPWNP